MGEVQHALQSNENINLQDGMQVHLVHVGMPQGGVASRKRKHYGFKLPKFLGTKKSVIRIQNNDLLCLACALVADMAQQEKHPDWNSIRQGRQQQRILAKELHQKAGIPEGLCGLPEVRKFQQVIEDYQIIAIAHNLRGCDGFLLCEHFYKKLLLPKLILNRAKIMSMELEEAEIKFRDSLNFLPVPLNALPKTFGRTELKKGYFPHFFNRKENQTYVGPLPPVEDYDPDSLSAKERKDFLAWYEELKSAQYLFNFEQEIEEYCHSDVDILRRCCLKFKQLMEETCHLDPFKYGVTIASACNRVFRQEFLEEDTIGLIPPQGFQPARRYSVMALKWLAWVHHQTGDCILHALNGGNSALIVAMLMVMILSRRLSTSLWVYVAWL